MRNPSLVLSLLVAVAGVGCSPAPEMQVDTVAGAALEGLTVDEQRRFHAGRREFMETDATGEGLGPMFNGNSCAQCHNQPAEGGPGLATVVRAGCLDAQGAFVEPPGGSLVFLFSTRPDIVSATIPAHCKLVEKRRTTSVLGAGLIEAIPDEAIVAQAAAPRPEGVGGRVGWVMDDAGRSQVGRFGWKAQHATLRSFAGDAYRNEMGITNELFPTENAPGGSAEMLAMLDWVKDPEARVGAIDALADFMRFRAPPAPRGAFPDAEVTFEAIGCAACHRPHYQTGPSASPALNLRDVPLYSDLLLHDVGTGTVIPQGPAQANELRTPPLWGLGTTPLLLHDGRTTSVDEAILAHDREAAAARRAYQALPTAERDRLVEFLRSL